MTPARHRHGRRPAPHAKASTGVDVLTDAVAALTVRPFRTVLAALGATVGIGVLVATITIATSSDQHVADQFDAIRQTQITAQNPADKDWIQQAGMTRLRAYPGVTAAGITWTSQDPAPIGRLPAGWGQDQTATVVAADPTALQALGAVALSGRLYDDGSDDRGDAVVVVGAGLARSIGLAAADGTTAITVAGRRLTVEGIAAPADRGDPNILLNLYVVSPNILPAIRWQTPQVHVQTDTGLTDAVASNTALLLRPDSPTTVTVQAPADPTGLRSSVTGSIRTLLMALGAVCLVIGAIMIGSTTLMRVAERRPEIALRRALGTSRTAIASQIATESTLIGAAGGLTGTYLGQAASALIATGAGWPPIVNIWLLPAGLALGAVIGGVAGLYPSIRSARQDPAEALQT